MKQQLAGSELFGYNPAIIPDSLDYSDESNTIGIITHTANGIKTFAVYQKGERGEIDWEKPFDIFNDAIEYAKKMYKGMLSYFEEMGEPAAEIIPVNKNAGSIRHRPAAQRNAAAQRPQPLRIKRRWGRSRRTKGILTPFQSMQARAEKTYSFYVKPAAESRRISRREYR